MLLNDSKSPNTLKEDTYLNQCPEKQTQTSFHPHHPQRIWWAPLCCLCSNVIICKGFMWCALIQKPDPLYVMQHPWSNIHDRVGCCKAQFWDGEKSFSIKLWNVSGYHFMTYCFCNYDFMQWHTTYLENNPLLSNQCNTRKCLHSKPENGAALLCAFGAHTWNSSTIDIVSTDQVWN